MTIICSCPHAVCQIRKIPVSLKPFRLFGVLSFTYVGAMVSSNTALSYISYPTQVSWGIGMEGGEGGRERRERERGRKGEEEEEREREKERRRREREGEEEEERERERRRGGREREMMPTLLPQVIGKSAKPIPVLFFGVFSGHRKYPLIKYLIVVLIVIGVIFFNYKDGGGRSTGDDQYKLFDLLGAGEILVVSPIVLCHCQEEAVEGWQCGNFHRKCIASIQCNLLHRHCRNPFQFYQTVLKINFEIDHVKGL